MAAHNAVCQQGEPELVFWGLVGGDPKEIPREHWNPDNCFWTDATQPASDSKDPGGAFRQIEGGDCLQLRLDCTRGSLWAWQDLPATHGGSAIQDSSQDTRFRALNSVKGKARRLLLNNSRGQGGHLDREVQRLLPSNRPWMSEARLEVWERIRAPNSFLPPEKEIGHRPS